MPLFHYLKSREVAGMPAISSALIREKSAINPGVMRDDEIWPLINFICTIDDAVAVATLLRRYAERKHISAFNQVAQQLEEAPFINEQILYGESVKVVSLISAVTDGPHVMLVNAYAAALLVQPVINKVHLIFTGEWEWSQWSKVNQDKTVVRLRDGFIKQASHFSVIRPLISELDARLSITLAPRSEDLSHLLGDVVIRFEGPAIFKTTHLYSKAIHQVRPVVTATFSSRITSGKNSDATLVRGQVSSGCQFRYVPPAAISMTPIPAMLRERDEYIVATVYSQERIRIGLEKMSNKDWDAITRLFQSVPTAKWLLVGANDIQAARKTIPKHIEEKFHARIQILGHSSLDEVYSKAFAFLSFPGMFGGGGAAAIAIAYGVPVLVNSDPRSDISNAIDNSLHVAGFLDSCTKLREWVADPSSWLQFVAKQQNHFADRMDLVSKGQELLRILTVVLNKRQITEL